MPRFYKGIVLLQLLVLIGLQSTLWWGDHSLQSVWSLQERVEKLTAQNDRRFDRNESLHAEILALKSHDTVAIEEKARLVLGMVKPDETFFVVPDRPRD